MPHLDSGVIVLWSGSIATIPAGFVICDGTNATPDLRDRFIIGAGTTYNPDDTGGSQLHGHAFTGDGHFHNLAPGGIFGPGTGYAPLTDSQPATGNTDPDGTLPPYYSLAFIMKT